MTRSKTAILGIAVALVLPLSFYLIAKGLGKDHLTMPNYYINGDTLKSTLAMAQMEAGKIHPVEEFAGTNQFGDAVQLNRDLKNKLVVVNVFFTTCKSTCPTLTQNLRILEFAFRRTPMARNDTAVQFVSISVDPGNDTTAALRAFAQKYKADENHWWFMRADKKYTYAWIRNQLRLSTPGGDGGADDFIHSNTLVVMDRDRYIRGYYDGLDTAAIGRCAYDLGLLAMEKKHK
jgi:protein SCO1/2